MPSSPHTLIIGGGVIGVSAAYCLAKRGARVTLIDRGNFDTCCSTGNAGIIALGHPPMPRPGLIGQTMRMLFNPLNPLYIPPRFDLELLRWMWAFRKACSRERFAYSMRVLADLGFAAGEAFDSLVEEEGIECEYHKTGWLDVFATEKRFAQGRDEAELIRSYGYDVHVLGGDELRRRDSAFKPNVLGAAHYTDSRFANPGMLLRELANRAQEHGAALRTNTEVQAILTERLGRFSGVELATGERLPADDLILAGGAWTTQLARTIGIEVPMQPGKGYHMNILLPEGAPRIGATSVMAETFVAVTPISDEGAPPERCLRLAGTIELSGMNHTMVQKRLDMLRIGARAYLHGIDEAETLSTWCGLRPCTADGLPIIGWAPGFENVFVATGHAMMGFALGPITGRLASECILDGEASMDIAAFTPSRYVGTTSSSPRRRGPSGVSVCRGAPAGFPPSRE